MLYRIESQRLKNSEIFYLVKSVRLGDNVTKIRVKLGNIRPSLDEERRLVSTPNVELEYKVLSKQVSEDERRGARFLTPDELHRVEESRHWDSFFRMFFTPVEWEQVEAGYEVEYIAGTTGIEGNTLTVQQVDELTQGGAVPSGKSLREINEVQNYIKVGEFRGSIRGRVTIPFIRKLHSIIMDKIDLQSAGEFRRIDNIGIRGVDIAVSPSIQIGEDLEEIIGDYYSRIKAGGNPFEEAVLFHLRFEVIHPFTDGNGRVGREVLNHMLTRAGYPRLIVTRVGREKYLEALKQGNDGRVEVLVSMFVDLLIDERAMLFEGIIKRGQIVR